MSEAQNEQITINAPTVLNHDTESHLEYSKMNESMQEFIDLYAREILSSKNGKIIITGEKRTGKSLYTKLFINNLNIYKDKIKFEEPIFILIDENVINVINDYFDRDVEYYLSTMSNEFFHKELKDICLVVRNSEIAEIIYKCYPQAKMIVEVEESRLLELEEATNISSLWDDALIISVDDVYFTINELTNIIEKIIKEHIEKVYYDGIYSKNRIKGFIKFIMSTNPELIFENIDKKGTKTETINLPLGYWITVINRMFGTLALDSTNELKLSNNRVNNKLLYEKTFMQNESFFVTDNLLDSIPDDTEIQKIFDTYDITEINFVDDKGKPLQSITRSEFEKKNKATQPTKEKENTTIKFKDVLTLKERMKKEIVGQDEALDDICDALVEVAAGLNDPKKPLASFLLLGPTGVGKTETCYALLRELFDEPYHFIRLNMTEYQNEIDMTKLFGSSPGYQGSDRDGFLTGEVLKNPKSLILIDEVEKAHMNVIQSFLNILDDGSAVNNQGEIVDFKQTIIIMTSNAGSQQMAKRSSGFSISGTNNFTNSSKEDTMRKAMIGLKEKFTPEFLNRLTGKIVYQNLNKEIVSEIVMKFYKRAIERVNKPNLTFDSLNNDIIDEILELSNYHEYGAREIENNLKFIRKPLSRWLIENNDREDNIKISFILKDDRTIEIIESTELVKE